VYQLASYDHWAEQLGRADFAYGQFGENFTVSGLPDDEVCIGDRYRIGTALFEVSQPRVTCYRIGIRMDEPRMAALLTRSGRPGFYLRVLEEGAVEAGEDITKEADGPERMTVAEANALLYHPPHPRGALERALRIAALSPGWQASFQALLDAHAGSGNAGLASSTPQPPAWTGFRAARLIERRRESAAVWSFVLEPEAPAAGGSTDPSSGDTPVALPGQCATLRLPADPAGVSLLRSYSLSTPPAHGHLQISVKREERGQVSRMLIDHYRVGDTIEVAAPRGAFVLRPGDGPVALTSAGIGATPVLAMLHALVAEGSRREVWWLHGARRRAEHSFAPLVDTLLAQLPKAHRHVRYSQPDPGDRIRVDYDARGRLNADVIAELGIPRNTEYYLCGPADFLAELPPGLVAHGVPAQQIHTEIFGARPAQEPGIVPACQRPPHQPAVTPGTGPAVSFSRSDVSTRFSPAYGSLLELAEACDVPVRWSCRTGVCHSCETDLLAGVVAYDPEPIDPPGDGKVLICCCRPVVEVVLDL
jgi:ferredoxin-NADP reductase/MOSC domain-containing protein YiiM